MEIEIRRATEKDLAQIFDIEKRTFLTYWSYEMLYEDICKTPISYYLVALENEKVLGYIGMWHVMDEGHILNVAIDTPYRNLKIGSILLKELLDYCKEIGIERVTLEVREHNEPALGLYKKFGFIEMGLRKNYYQDTNENAIIMWKEV